jgi:hypothetical protein
MSPAAATPVESVLELPAETAVSTMSLVGIVDPLARAFVGAIRLRDRATTSALNERLRTKIGKDD